MTASRRVVVTGMGIISPLGNDLELSWQNILDGKSGARTVTRFDVSDYPTKFAASVENFDEINHLDIKTKRRVDEFIQYGLVASKHAIENSGLELDSLDSTRIGVSIGSVLVVWTRSKKMLLLSIKEVLEKFLHFLYLEQ